MAAATSVHLSTVSMKYRPPFISLKCFDACGRFNHLRELIPNKEKLDKAAFLMSTMDYIKQLQVILSVCIRSSVPPSSPCRVFLLLPC